MSINLLVVAVVTIFGIFVTAVTYAEVRTRGIVAPGGRKPD